MHNVNNSSAFTHFCPIISKIRGTCKKESDRSIICDKFLYTPTQFSLEMPAGTLTGFHEKCALLLSSFYENHNVSTNFSNNMLSIFQVYPPRGFRVCVWGRGHRPKTWRRNLAHFTNLRSHIYSINVNQHTTSTLICKQQLYTRSVPSILHYTCNKNKFHQSAFQGT
jgi:hypothetical protein